LPGFAATRAAGRAYLAIVAPQLGEIVRASAARAWLQGDPRRAVDGALILREDLLEFRASAHVVRVPLAAIIEVGAHEPFAGTMRIVWRLGRAELSLVWQVDDVAAWIQPLQQRMPPARSACIAAQPWSSPTGMCVPPGHTPSVQTPNSPQSAPQHTGSEHQPDAKHG
jgi:hypothetical protein